jgi:hypothetical protein
MMAAKNEYLDFGVRTIRAAPTQHLVLGYFITCPQIPFAILSNAGLSNIQPAGFM